MKINQLHTDFSPFMDEHEFKNESHEVHRWYFKFDNYYGAKVSSNTFNETSETHPFSVTMLDYKNCDKNDFFDPDNAEKLRRFENLTDADVNKLLHAMNDIQR